MKTFVDMSRETRERYLNSVRCPFARVFVPIPSDVLTKKRKFASSKPILSEVYGMAHTNRAEPRRQGPFPEILVVLDAKRAKRDCGSSPASAGPTAHPSPARRVSTAFWSFYRGELPCAQSFTGWSDIWSARKTPSRDTRIVITAATVRCGTFHRYTWRLW
jgi:hypothetical protein